jgi:predicted Zn-ribbon and HTH transcriptional regulator
MRELLRFRIPKWNEKRFLLCRKCGHRFLGFKIPFFRKCPRCGSRKVVEDPSIRY